MFRRLCSRAEVSWDRESVQSRFIPSINIYRNDIFIVILSRLRSISDFADKQARDATSPRRYRWRLTGAVQFRRLLPGHGCLDGAACGSTWSTWMCRDVSGMVSNCRGCTNRARSRRICLCRLLSDSCCCQRCTTSLESQPPKGPPTRCGDEESTRSDLCNTNFPPFEFRKDFDRNRR